MSSARPKPKRVRRAIRKLAKDAVRFRLAEHLHEAGLLAPSNALIFAAQVLDDLRPMLEHEAREVVKAEKGVGPHYATVTTARPPGQHSEVLEVQAFAVSCETCHWMGAYYETREQAEGEHSAHESIVHDILSDPTPPPARSRSRVGFDPGDRN